jgi:hypothetical protein
MNLSRLLARTPGVILPGSPAVNGGGAYMALNWWA